MNLHPDLSGCKLRSFNTLPPDLSGGRVLKLRPDWGDIFRLKQFLDRYVATAHDVVILLTVNSGFADMLHNFLCYYAEAEVQNSLFIFTNDGEISDIVTRSGYHAILMDFSSDIMGPLTYNTLEYQGLMHARSRLMQEILLLRYRLFNIDVDAVWLSNPLVHLSCTQDCDFDVAAQLDTPNSGLCCGLLYLDGRSENVRALWADTVRAHNRLLAITRASETKLRGRYDTEQFIFNSLLVNQYADRVRVRSLNGSLFPSGYVYFKQKSARMPDVVVVHNNWIMGEQDKRERFKKFNLWRVAVNGTCTT